MESFNNVRCTFPGREVKKVLGREDFKKGKHVTFGFASYSEESGPMEPQYQAEEIVYISSADKGWVKYGDQLENVIKLRGGILLHFEAQERRVFEYGKGGYVDMIFISGEIENLLPVSNYLLFAKV